MSGPIALLWGLSCFAFGWLARRWAYRLPAARRAQVETSPIDLRATLDTPRADIDKLLAACKITIAEGHEALFEEARRRP
jgi:hypothetical protein